MRLEGRLPPEWGAGFRRLEVLEVANLWDGPPKGPAQPLPAQWAEGFPSLLVLQLHHLALAGPLPAAWVEPSPKQQEQVEQQQNQGFTNLTHL